MAIAPTPTNPTRKIFFDMERPSSMRPAQPNLYDPRAALLRDGVDFTSLSWPPKITAVIKSVCRYDGIRSGTGNTSGRCPSAASTIAMAAMIKIGRPSAYA